MDGERLDLTILGRTLGTYESFEVLDTEVFAFHSVNLAEGLDVRGYPTDPMWVIDYGKGTLATASQTIDLVVFLAGVARAEPLS